MATNPYAGLTNLVGMALRADAQQDLMRFREEDLAFRKQQAEDRLAVDKERNRISEINATANTAAADVQRSAEERAIKEANEKARETYAYQTLNLFTNNDFNGRSYIDDKGNLDEEVFKDALSAGEDLAVEYSIGIGNKFGFSGEVKKDGFRVTSLVRTRMSGSLPEGQQGPVQPGTELGSGLSSLTGRVNPNKQTGEQLYSLVGQYDDGTIAPLTQDGRTDANSPIVEATAAQLARMAVLDWRSNVKGTTIGGTTLNLYRTGLAANRSLTVDQVNKDDQKDLLLGQVDTATEAMARENPDIRRAFISMLSDPELSKDEQDEMVLEFAQTIGLDIPSILTTEGPKQIVGGDPDQPASMFQGATDPALQIGMQSAANPTGFGFAPFIDPDRDSTSVQKSIRQAKIKVDRLDNEIEKLRANPNKSAELVEKQIERNTLVYKTNGENLLDIKQQIKNTEQSIAQDATGNTTDLEERLSGLREKESQLIKAGVRTEGMETEAYKALEEQLFGKENLVELLKNNSPETFEKLKKEAEAKVEAGFTPNASAATDFQRVLEGLGVTNDLRQAQNIPIKEQIMLRSILAASAAPTNRPDMLQQYDAIVGIDTRTQGEIEEADRERIRITGEAARGILNAESSLTNARVNEMEAERKRAELNDPLQREKLFQEVLELTGKNEDAKIARDSLRVADYDKEVEIGKEIREVIDQLNMDDEIEAGEPSRKLALIMEKMFNRAKRYTRTTTNEDGEEVIYFTNPIVMDLLERQSNSIFSNILQKLAADEGNVFNNRVRMQLNDFEGKAVSFNSGSNEFVVVGPDGVRQGGAVSYEDVERLNATLARSLKIMADANRVRIQKNLIPTPLQSSTQ